MTLKWLVSIYLDMHKEKLKKKTILMHLKQKETIMFNETHTFV